MSISRRNFHRAAMAGTLGLLAPACLRGVEADLKLLVWLVCEQFSPQYLARTETSLSQGGFRRLLSEGAYFPSCRHLASTFTASGLATLSTGAYPDIHGIVADHWYDRASRQPIAANPDLLEATTLGDQLRDRPNTRVFGCGMEQSHVRLLVGRSGTQAFWMGKEGDFQARGQVPSWLGEFNRLRPLEKFHNAKWSAVGALPDAPPLRTLAYDPARPEEFHSLYRASPFAQSAQLDFVRELIARERLGQAATFDFLAVTLAPMALLGYELGSESPLMEQMVLNLDRDIETTLEFLNKIVGAGRYAFVFAAAHGAPQEPRLAVRETMAVSGEKVARAIDQALSDRFDTPPTRNIYVEKYLYPFLYLRHDQVKRNLREARQSAGQAALNLPGVAGFFTADGDTSHHGEWNQRFRNSFHAVRSGDVMLSYKPEFIEDFGSLRGVSYGSLYNYDAYVPLFFYGPGFRARTFDQQVESADIAPTLARYLAVSTPSSGTGRILEEALFSAK